MNVQGSCDAQFQAVRGEFERNFQERGEVGASLCVVLRGQIVVNLWGGTARCDTGAFMVATLEKEEPFWQPGKSLGTFFQDEKTNRLFPAPPAMVKIDVASGAGSRN